MNRFLVAFSISLALPAGLAHADGITCHHVESGAIKVDGALGEWTTIPGIDVGGHDPDLSFTVHCAYDAKALYLGVAVRDDYFARSKAGRTGEDHLDLAFADGAKVDRLVIYPGDPDAGIHHIVKWGSDRGVKGIQVAESKLGDGWTVEARLQFADLPGYHAGAPLAKLAVGVSDCDSSALLTAEGNLTTSPMDSVATLGAVQLVADPPAPATPAKEKKSPSAKNN